jgi:transglutaminase-like putative cysteine protease/glutamine cyclotransferase
MRKLMFVSFVLALATLPACAQDVPGEVLASYPLAVKTPTGLAWDGSHLWLADLGTATLNELDPSNGKVLRSIAAPGYAPTGLAWDGTKLWVLDAADKTAYALDTRSGETLRALPLDTDTPEGLAWDGKDLWVADARSGVIVRLDEQDGTTYLSVPCPTAGGPRKTQEIGLAVAGTFLYVSDRVADTIYRLDLKTGTLLDGFDAPGPYATGLAWDGRDLWCADYEARTLYRLVAATHAPYVTSRPRHELVTYTEAWRNFGPGLVKTIDVYVAVPSDLPTQKILKAPDFEPKPADFVTDQWGQKCAHFVFRDVKAGEEARAVMKVEAEVRSARWFVDPDAVGSLADIPADIVKTYTQDSSKLVLTDPVIQKAVQEALGDERNPYWMARKINKFIQDRMRYEMVGGWNVAPVVLSRGTGSCSEYTFVMLAMCHAAGLPARYQGSVVVRGDEASRDMDFHRWVEVYLPNYGWVPVDPSGGDSPVPVDQANMFGGLENRFLITTVGAGDSRYLGWNYNSDATWTAKGPVKLMQLKAGDWEPVGKKFEPKVQGEPGGLTCAPKG